MKHLKRCYTELLTNTPDPVIAIEQAGRLCYKSQKHCTECDGSGWRDVEIEAGKFEKQSCMDCNGRATEFVRMLIKRGHEAMIEHAVATFKFICDRGVTHELVRHRLASYAQESTRYCNYSKDKFDSEITVIRPPELTEQQWERRKKVLEHIELLYQEEVGEGVKPQIARGVLPISLKTEIICTANFRQWRTMMKLRTSKAAHPQIRQMMSSVHNVFKMEWPVFVEDIEPYEHTD